jgi:DNA-directed RNA polymerase subunit H (RpoH/RPB5)
MAHATTSPIYILWRSLRTVDEMLIDRGYVRRDEDWEPYLGKEKTIKTKKEPIEKEDEAPKIVTEEDFLRVHSETATDLDATRKTLRLVYLSKGGEYAISVFWKSSLGIGDVQDIHEIMKEEQVEKAVVIHSSKITPYAATALRNLRVQKIIIETFTDSEMQYNVVHHVDVPRHIICSTAKKAEILKDYSVTAEQLPQIKTTDPVCRYYGASKGQLIKIVRPSDCMPELVTATGEKKELYDIVYRIVV